MTIVGSDLRLAERVTGRLTRARAAHAATRGQRDFSSVRTLAAGRYDLIAREGAADRARTMLGQVGLLPAARG